MKPCCRRIHIAIYMEPKMKLILCAVDEALADAWQRFCGDLEFVSVHHGSILEVKCNAVVSPANSFGFMDGGIDAQYSSHFGLRVERRVQQMILQRHHGELLVGHADIVDTDHAQIPYLIVAPTMRVPMILRDSVNPYLAARAILLLWKHGIIAHGSAKDIAVKDVVETIAMPGLGTGIGRIGPNTCAHQVRQAIDDFVLEKFNPPESWAHASERHQLLYTERLKRLQHEE